MGHKPVFWKRHTHPNSKHLREMVAVISTIFIGLHSQDYEICLSYAFQMVLMGLIILCFRGSVSLSYQLIICQNYLISDNHGCHLFFSWVCIYVGLIQTQEVNSKWCYCINCNNKQSRKFQFNLLKRETIEPRLENICPVSEHLCKHAGGNLY